MPILHPEYMKLLSLCKSPEDRIYCTIMFLTGIRISNLTMLTYKDLTVIASRKNHVYFHGIKTLSNRMLGLYLTAATRAILRNISKDFKVVIDEARARNVDFETTSIVQIHPKSLIRRINKILKALSKQENATFKPHSFRIGVALRDASVAGIDKAKHLLNHQSINTTMMYLPNGLATDEAVALIQKIFSNTGTHEIEGDAELYEEVSRAFGQESDVVNEDETLLNEDQSSDLVVVSTVEAHSVVSTPSIAGDSLDEDI